MATAARQIGTFERAWRRAGFQIIHANILHPLGLMVEGRDGPIPAAALPAWAETAAPAVRDELLRGIRDAWELAGRADLVDALLYAVGLEVRAGGDSSRMADRGAPQPPSRRVGALAQPPATVRHALSRSTTSWITRQRPRRPWSGSVRPATVEERVLPHRAAMTDTRRGRRTG
ncbi:MAG: hypothetical protein U0232_14565 [Thermomicrobiales bacterium]